MNASFAFPCANTANNGFGIDWSVLAVVIVGVIVLMLVIRVIGVLAAGARPEPGPKLAINKRTGEPAAVAASVDGISPELVAVLTAAASAALGSPVRICEISAGKMNDQRSWSQEGRREIYLSHRIR